ncbi:mechanosensitive ion channel domain-containing protein [Oscillatoria salina]|uniref:mechanosensitive ion channel domain-containing protein n=1 Tax=Oscillatoria salina TaxID=331517 RepID=UPI0013BCF8E3|nr:mechanosensitive ion channel domain-containing protein [Oscillatoria salina]MBZ8183277.1 mechanosensitive ion channel [Oscillatoria salina IIICB1]NET89235.1 mechanosensitive ion channel [Kamptonema sp. SIO1D9]
MQLLKSLIEIFTLPLFEVGDASFSLVSLAKIFLALLIVLVVVRTSRKLLKEKLLSKLIPEEGNRDAIAAIVSYGIGVLGFIVVLESTGFNLASLAVLAGGLGVGIGFGLQDVTRNFVSGVTLLLDRKLKVGDFVEFDGLTGYVKEISIRSTVIRTIDGGDVVVPNSNLVETKILNWSYDSYIGCIGLQVSVEPDNNPLEVTETLLNSAYMEPAVLTEPAPQVIFKGFGEDSLDFALRVWVNRIDEKLTIRSSLYYIIEYNLREAGIEVSTDKDFWIKNPAALKSLLTEGEKSSHDGMTLVKEKVETTSQPLSLRNLLRHVKYFENFTDLQLRRLIEVGYRKRLNESEILFREDDPGDAFYIVLSGAVEVYVEKINKHLTILKKGAFFGELSLVLGIPRTASVRAVEQTTLFAINNKGFEKILQDNPNFSEDIVQSLGRHKEELTERQKQLQSLGLVEKTETESSNLDWVRQRLKNLFSF